MADEHSSALLGAHGYETPHDLSRAMFDLIVIHAERYASEVAPLPEDIEIHNGIPLFQIPRMICSAIIPFDDGFQPEAHAACVFHWAKEVARAAIDSELPTRDPNSLLILAHDAPIPPEALVPLSSLKQWAREQHHINFVDDAGIPPPESPPSHHAPAIRPAIPRADRQDENVIAAIHAQRVERLRAWLIEQEIPESDWHCLSMHSHTKQSIYAAMAVFPEFQSQHGRGDAITPNSFNRNFWKIQTLAKIKPG